MGKLGQVFYKGATPVKVMAKPRVVVIGGGITGAAVAYDLAQRGLGVVLLERGSLGSGTSGRTHGLLHSGCRYIRDTEVARECYRENMVLRRIAPFLFEKNGGLFIAVTEEDLEYRDTFLEGCKRAGIPVKELSPEEALRLEPGLNPSLKAAVAVPDGTFDPLKVILSFLASAKRYGAEVRPYSEVVDILVEGGEARGVKVLDKTSLRSYVLEADFVVNAAGPWAGRVAALAGVHVPVRPSPGVMVAFQGRLGNMVFNRMNPPSDGDIIIHQRGISVAGTTSWVVDDPDGVEAPRGHVDLIVRRAAEMAPRAAELPIRAVYVSSRPLVGEARGTGRGVSRSFEVFDHEAEGVAGFASIAGGKFTTARLMAEKMGDLVAEKLGVEAASRTAEEPLTPYWLYF